MKKLLTIVLYIFIGFVIAFIINNYIIINAHVVSQSMEGTIASNSRILGLRNIFVSNFNQGDIIVFKSPIPDEINKPFVKRIIGLPGDEVAINGGIIFINGKALYESYISGNQNTLIMQNFDLYIVPHGYIFVMGDNRGISRDSRSFGAIPINSIIGKIYLYR